MFMCRPKNFVALLCAVAMFFCSQGISSAQETQTGKEKFDVKELVPRSAYNELLKNGKIEYLHDGSIDSLLLLPYTKYAGIIQNGRIRKNRKGYVVEALYLEPKDTYIAHNVNYKDEGVNIATASYIFRSFSKMAGMTYYSLSDEETDVLYSDAYTFANENDRSRVPDKNTGSADGLTTYLYQHDKTFGDCYYRAECYQEENEMAMVFTIIDYVKYAGIRAVKPEKMKVNVSVADCGDNFLVYVAIDVDAANVPFLRQRILNSFRARVDAIYKWFSTQF